MDAETALGAALENFPARKRKKVLVRHKNVTKHNSCHPQNWQFPLSTMVANIYL
jgi:hypothetical protein